MVSIAHENRTQDEALELWLSLELNLFRKLFKLVNNILPY